MFKHIPYDMFRMFPTLSALLAEVHEILPRSSAVHNTLTRISCVTTVRSIHPCNPPVQKGGSAIVSEFLGSRCFGSQNSLIFSSMIAPSQTSCRPVRSSRTTCALEVISSASTASETRAACLGCLVNLWICRESLGGIVVLLALREAFCLDSF